MCHVCLQYLGLDAIATEQQNKQKKKANFHYLYNEINFENLLSFGQNRQLYEHHVAWGLHLGRPGLQGKVGWPQGNLPPVCQPGVGVCI